MTNANHSPLFLLLIENLKGLMAITLTSLGIIVLWVNDQLSEDVFNGPRRSAVLKQFINQLGLRSL